MAYEGFKVSPNLGAIEEETGQATREAIRLIWLLLGLRKEDLTITEDEESPAFGIIHVEDQEDVVADQPMDTLTLIEGTGIVITTNPFNDSVTIATTCCDDDGNAGTGTECLPQWTTSPLLQAPPAADGVAIAGGGSAWTAGSWVEIEDATTTEWLLAEIHLYLPTSPAPTDSEFEVEIGVGAAGAETIIATITGTVTGGSFGGWKLNYPLPAPIKLIPAGSRVAARIRKSGTDTDTFYCSVGYYEWPLNEEVAHTTSPLFVHPPASTRIGVTPNASAWVDSDWFEVTGATGTDWIVAGVYLEPTTTVAHHYYELDIGIGEAGSEEVITTIRDSWNLFSTRKGGPSVNWIRPMIDAIPAGSRVAVRMRKNTTETNVRRCALMFYREHIPALTTAQPQLVYPPAANNTALGESGFEPATAEAAQLATVGDTWAITGFAMRASPDSTSDLPTRFLLTAGSNLIDRPSFETPIAAANATTPDGADYFTPFVFAMDVGVGDELWGWWAATAAGETWESAAFTYIVDPDFAQRGAVRQFIAKTSSTPHGVGSWSNGSWIELTPAYATDTYLVGFRPGATTGDDVEVDIAIGDSGSEVVITTLRYADVSGLQFIRLPIPHKISSGNRIACRARSTNGQLAQIWFAFVDDFEGPGTCGPTSSDGSGEDALLLMQIAAPNQPTLVLTDGDTLLLKEGSNIDLTIDAEGKSLTIAATGLASSGDITASGLTCATDRLLGRDTAGTGAIEEITIGAGLSLSGKELAASAAVATGTVGIVIDGGGSAITTGVKGYVEVPFSGTITKATVLADQTGSIVIDVWKDTYANFPPTDADSITASAPPTLSSAQKSQDSTLTGWTTSITAGDIIGFNVDSITTVTRVTLQLTVDRA